MPTSLWARANYSSRDGNLLYELCQLAPGRIRITLREIESALPATLWAGNGVATLKPALRIIMGSGGKPSTGFPPEGTRGVARSMCRVSLNFQARGLLSEIVQFFPQVFVPPGSIRNTHRLDFGGLSRISKVTPNMRVIGKLIFNFSPSIMKLGPWNFTER